MKIVHTSDWHVGRRWKGIQRLFGIGQGEGHDNLYSHNDAYDGYHCAISISEASSDTAKPNGKGAADNTIAFNHVYNLLQGIMNDGGSIRIESGNQAFTAVGNKILNNKIHDTSDASALDPGGYGGNGIYLDNQTGLVDVENNLVYRVSGNAVFAPQGPAAQNETNIIKNNILAFARQALIAVNSPYQGSAPYIQNQVFTVENNLMYLDRSNASTPGARSGQEEALDCGLRGDATARAPREAAPQQPSPDDV